jgi:hypothetical protein
MLQIISCYYLTLLHKVLSSIITIFSCVFLHPTTGCFIFSYIFVIILPEYQTSNQDNFTSVTAFKSFLLVIAVGCH